jgi:hypothetical protein
MVTIATLLGRLACLAVMLEAVGTVAWLFAVFIFVLAHAV